MKNLMFTASFCHVNHSYPGTKMEILSSNTSSPPPPGTQLVYHEGCFFLLLHNFYLGNPTLSSVPSSIGNDSVGNPGEFWPKGLGL